MNIREKTAIYFCPHCGDKLPKPALEQFLHGWMDCNKCGRVYIEFDRD